MDITVSLNHDEIIEAVKDFINNKGLNTGGCDSEVVLAGTKNNITASVVINQDVSIDLGPAKIKVIAGKEKDLSVFKEPVKEAEPSPDVVKEKPAEPTVEVETAGNTLFGDSPAGVTSSPVEAEPTVDASLFQEEAEPTVDSAVTSDSLFAV